MVSDSSESRLAAIAKLLEDLEEHSVHSPMAYYLPGEDYQPALEAVCQTYLSASKRQRTSLRDAVRDKKGVLNQLLACIYWAAEQLRATKDVRWLRIGAAAAALQNGALDYRDYLWALADLYVSAQEVGLDPDAEFEALGGELPDDFGDYAVVSSRRTR